MIKILTCRLSASQRLMHEQIVRNRQSPMPRLDELETKVSQQKDPMRRFDANALHLALDGQRTKEGLLWRQVAEIIGVSVTTLRRTQRGGRLEIDGTLAMVGWLRLPIEHFVRETRS